MANQIMIEEKPNASVRKEKIGPNAEGQRIDNFLVGQLKGVPKSRIYRMIRKGEVRVNGGRISAEYRLVMGDEVRIPPVRTAENAGAASNGEHWLPPQLVSQIQTLYEDQDLWVLNKPAGIAVHGGSGVTTGLIEYLRSQHPDAPYLELAHRLDRETSGCLMLAKNRQALLWLQDQMKSGKISKYYLMLVQGKWDLGKKTLTMALDTDHRKQGERHVQASQDGKKAVTKVSPIELFGKASILEADLLTGRTHQIRVHLAEMGFPLLGDRKYGTEESMQYSKHLGVKRVLLHAHRLIVTLPGKGREIEVSSPYPEEFRTLINRLEQA